MNPYILHVIITVGIFSILSLSLNVIVGLAGLVSLGHAAFFGIGAYVSALLMIKGLAFHWALPAAGLVSSLLGLCLALPAAKGILHGAVQKLAARVGLLPDPGHGLAHQRCDQGPRKLLYPVAIGRVGYDLFDGGGNEPRPAG